jgi:hypothetical protein
MRNVVGRESPSGIGVEPFAGARETADEEHKAVRPQKWV